MGVLPPRLGLVAGEASGDALGGAMLQGLKRRWPGFEAVGVGGPRMIAQGFRCWWPSERLSVFGYADALARLPELLLLRRELGSRLIRDRCAAFIGIDAPDFNFGLETRLRAAGLATIHYVCPSIWAWRPHRVERLAAAADHVLCLFPFEPELLHRHGIAATFVGHPLADEIAFEPPREAARAALGLPADASVVALLPGSRASEIAHIGPAFVEAAAVLQRTSAGLRFVLPAAPGQREAVDALIARLAPEVGIKVHDGRVHEALAACDVALVASGTATLEAALHKRPMVVAYRLGRLNWWRMRRLALQPWFGLPNILARRFVVPELIQDAATPQALAREVLRWLDDPARADAVRREFIELHHQLRRDNARRASDAIAEVVKTA